VARHLGWRSASDLPALPLGSRPISVIFLVTHRASRTHRASPYEVVAGIVQREFTEPSFIARQSWQTHSCRQGAPASRDTPSAPGTNWHTPRPPWWCTGQRMCPARADGPGAVGAGTI
jgi:hypothetical protein